MATAIGRKTLCSTCQKAAGVFTCRGCGKDFCYRHVAEHRQELNKQMDVVATDHDQLKQTIADQEAQPYCHPLIAKINVWEQESIDKIHQAANNARQELVTVLGTRRNKVTNDLTSLSQELNRARAEDDYVETDLKEWIEKLDTLKRGLGASQAIDFGHSNSDSALISKIFINGISADFFDQILGDIQVTEGGRVVVHGQTHQHAAVRGRGEYSLGHHQIRFKMEQCGGNGGFLFGILSKDIPLETVQHILSSRNMYDHEYRSNNYEVFNPQHYNGLVYFIIHPNSTRKNDIVELFIDCDQQTIRLTNERTGQKEKINISLTACRFPWQFFIALLYANDRVRLCGKKMCGTI